MSPLDRVHALTLCIEDALKANRLDEIPTLLDARGQMIDEMVRAGKPLNEEKLTQIRELEAELVQKMRVRRNAALERLNGLRTAKRARQAYTAPTF